MKLQSTLEVLTEARALIANNSAWTTQREARDKNGTPTQFWDSQACQFCAIGAVARAVGRLRTENPLVSEEWKVYKNAEEKLQELAGEPVHVFNDTHTHAEVLELFDKAIQNEAQVNS